MFFKFMHFVLFGVMGYRLFTAWRGYQNALESDRVYYQTDSFGAYIVDSGIGLDIFVIGIIWFFLAVVHAAVHAITKNKNHNTSAGN